MQDFWPQISVKLVKAIKRTMVAEGEAQTPQSTTGKFNRAPGTPVSPRNSSFDGLDLTPFLSDGGGVQLSKSVREAAGTFSITFRDSLGPDASLNKMVVDTVTGVAEPMDLIEIRMCRDPTLYGAGESPPVVMRGLITEVTRAESMDANGPMRTATIAGHDFGKILQILQIYYLNNIPVGEYYLDYWAFFQKYAPSGTPKIKPANEFLNGVIEDVVNKFLQGLTAFANGDSVGAKVINRWDVKANIEGSVDPWTVSSFNNVTLYQLLCTMLDVGPFNELFVEDTKDGVQIVLRPNPFLDVDGNPIQGVKAETISLTDDDVISMVLSRTDAGVANYYWVTNARLPMGDDDLQMIAQGGDPSNYILFDYLNCKAEFYGYRKMEVQTMLNDPAYSGIEGQKHPDVDDTHKAMTDWTDSRRKILSLSNRDNVVFDCGTIQIKGNEQVKAGRQLILTRANAIPITGYITRVQHSFSPLNSFVTTLTVERMTAFIERSKAQTPQYYPEVNQGGVT